jgi:hypothetical protein
MARTPNYSFERQSRERQKAAKLAEKAEAKRRAKEGDAAPPPETDDGAPGKD